MTAKKVSKQQDVVNGGDEIASLVDRFKTTYAKSKKIEAELKQLKTELETYALDEFCSRLKGGSAHNFKIAGDSSIATFVVQESSSKLTSDYVDQLKTKYGEEFVDFMTSPCNELVLNPEIVSQHKTRIIAALQQLPLDIFDNLVEPSRYSVNKGLLDDLAHFLEEDGIAEALSDFKFKKYIKG